MPINEIEELKNSFVRDLMPMRIYLFGSFAEGKQNKDSDFDFYIVVNDSESDVLTLTTKAYKSIRHKQKRPVDIIVNTEKTFESRKSRIMSVENEVAQKGVLLYGAWTNSGKNISDAILFAEEILKWANEMINTEKA